MLSYSSEDIVALATPTGLGALAVVRISGSNLYSTYKAFSRKNPIDRRAVFSKIYHPDNNRLLDEAIITYFKAPNSFTGEDVIEISCHGGIVVPHSIIEAAIDSGARTAKPGEFSFRAFLNGKMDLLQAEAISSLISSKSQLSADLSLHHLQGNVSKILYEIRTDTINILSIIENELNFSENEIDLTPYNKIREKVSNLQSKIQAILEASTFGKDILSGIRVVILGKPNSGKSSLFNAILGIDRAIVSNIPGTTRDTIESSFELEGHPVCLVDTAGVWESTNFLDKLSVQKTMDAFQKANLCILVDEKDPSNLLKSHFSTRFKDSCILVKSKCDNKDPNKIKDKNIFHVSTKEGLGISKLLTYISTYIIHNINNSNMLDHMLTTSRQRKLLELSLSNINDVLKQIDLNVETDIIASTLRGLVITIKDVVGEIPNNEIIDNIFSNFCVGK